MKRVVQIAAALLVAVLAIGLYKAKSDAAKAEAHVRALERQIGDAEADMRALRAEIAHLESPRRVESLAATHLGVSMGSQGAALAQEAIDQRLPAPRAPAPTAAPGREGER